MSHGTGSMLAVHGTVVLGLLSLSQPPADAEQKTLPSFGEPVKNSTVTEGRDAVLVCVTESLGNYKVAWVKVDTQTILTIGSHLITRNYQISLTQSDGRVWYLRISGVERSDAGWYMCQINTDPMISQTGYLEVVEPPDIVLDMSSKDMSVHEGDMARLRCVAHGYPTPTIRWLRESGEDRVLVTADGETHVNDTELAFLPVRRHHMAVYVCVATNGVPPAVSKRIVLQVQFAPMVNVTSQMLSAAQRTPVTLQCYTEAHPPSVTYWIKTNAGVVASGSKYKIDVILDGYKLTMQLKILKVDGADFTSYKCVAKNPLGEAEGTIRLTERPPTPEEQDALRADRSEEDRRRQQKQREATKEAARRREQRRRQQERRRQRGRQQQEQQQQQQQQPPPPERRQRPDGDRRRAGINQVTELPERAAGAPSDSAPTSPAISGLLVSLLLLQLAPLFGAY